MKPLVKQRTQVFNKPIGVTSIRTGEPEMWENIAASAEMRYRDAYQYNADQSKKKGEEAAAAIPTSDLFVIDPETRKPVALNPPRSFGLIGRQAYENIINRRFQESIQGELESKATEYAQKFPSSDAFHEQFARHIENMAAPAMDESGEMNAYGRVITELGSEYLASTTAAIKKKEAEIAKARIKRHNKMKRYVNTRQALVMAGEGDFTGAALMLDEEFSRVNEEWIAGEIAWSEYKSVLDTIEGFEAIAATNSLSKYYLEAQDVDQSLLRLAIQNVEYRKDLDDNIVDDIESALLTTSPANLISSLKSLDEDAETYMNNQISAAVNNQLSNINPKTTMRDIDRMVVSITDEDVRNGARKDFVVEAITQKVHNAISEIGDVGPLADELLNASFSDTDKLTSIVGADYVAALGKMSFETREDIAKGIQARSSALNNQRTEEQRNLSQGFNAAILDIRDNKTYSIAGRIEASAEIAKFIMSSDIDGKAGKMASLRDATAQAIRTQSRAIQVTPDQLDSIQAAVVNGAMSIEGTPEEIRLFAAMKYSYDQSPSATDGEFSRRRTNLTREIEKEKAQIISEHHAKAIDGQYATEEDIKAVDDKLFGGRTPSLPELLQNETVMNAAKKGYILPTFATGIYASFAGGDEQLSALALNTFKQFKLADAIVNGQSIQYNLMRKSLNATQYGMMDAALYAVNRLNASPSEFAMRSRSYMESGTDYLKEIRGDLGIAQGKNIATALDKLGISISPYFRQELTGAIIARKVIGMPVTEENLEGFVDEYVASMAMTEDAFVYAPTIDGKNSYARNLWGTKDDIQYMRDSVYTALEGDPKYQNLFTGGTLADAAIEMFMQWVPGRNAIDMLTKQEDEIMAMNTDRERIMAMERILGVKIMYQPVIEAFENGQPAYRAGYETSAGLFEPFMVNDEFVIVSPRPQEERTDTLLMQAINNRGRIIQETGRDYSKIADPNMRIMIARSDVEIRRLMGNEQTLEDFKANPQMFRELTDLLEGTGKTLEDIINGN